jgi:ribosomal protein S12 methylthiotransferase
LQQRLAREQNANRIGRQVRVLVEQAGEARSEWDAPEIDGKVFVPESLPVGEFASVRITASRDYDVEAVAVEPSDVVLV